MMTKSILALLALVLVAAASPVQARYYGDGWHGVRHHHRYHRGWRAYAPAVSDYYHHSRQLVGTR